MPFFFTPFTAQAENEDLLEWARKKNDEYLSDTGIVTMDLDVTCSSRAFFYLHDVLFQFQNQSYPQPFV